MPVVGADPGETSGWWDQVDAVLERIQAAGPDQRAAALAAACEEHPELRVEIESLAKHLEPGAALFDDLSDALGGRGQPTGAGLDHSAGPIRVGRYELIRKLPSGMCLVYEARDPDASQTVVIKLARPSADPTTRQRLVREAHADLDLDHPNICRVLDFGVAADGRPFLALEYYHGQTLASRLRQGNVPVDQVLDMGTQAADALAFAHGKGLVHRDVKPGNLMLVEDGSLRLLDFGIAKIGVSRFTASGMIVGTLVYMSPEQLRNQHVGPPTDVWSLGLVLYQALTRTHPFQGKSQRLTLHSMLRDPVEPASSRVAGVPRALDHAIGRALSRDADQRPTALEFSQILSSIQG